jgi:hypothetical protein
MLIAISVLLLGIGLCMCGWHLWRIYRRIFLLEAAVGTPSASHNSAMDAIAALADKWCDATNQPDSICVALYQFTTWARQQHQ